jgi:hypothetical protein
LDKTVKPQLPNWIFRLLHDWIQRYLYILYIHTRPDLIIGMINMNKIINILMQMTIFRDYIIKMLYIFTLLEFIRVISSLQEIPLEPVNLCQFH